MLASSVIQPHPININTLSKWLLLVSLIAVVIMVATGDYYWLALPFALIVGVLPFINIRFFFFFFLLLLPLSIEIQLFSSLSLTLPDEPMMVMILLIIVAMLIYNYKVFPKWFWNNSLTLIVFLQLIWTIVSVIYAQEHLYSFKFLAAKLWFLASFLIFPILIVRKKKDFKIILLVIGIPIVLHAIFAFGWHAIHKFGYFESNEVVKPFYRNHVDYGAALSMLFPAVYIAFLLARGKNWLRFILLAVLIFLVPAIFVASSRAAILAVMFAFIVLVTLKNKLVNWVLPLFFTFIVSMILLLSYNNKFLDFRPNISQNATQETFIETVVGAFTGKDMSSMERFYRWIASVRMVQEHPIVGVGPNNWYEHYKPHAVTSFRTWVSRNEEKSTTHNYFILMVTEQGIPAMVLYAILMIVIFAKGQKIYHRFQDRSYKLFTMALVMVIAASFVNNFFSEFLETHKVGGLFYISLALLIFLDQQSKKQTLESKHSNTLPLS